MAADDNGPFLSDADAEFVDQARARLKQLDAEILAALNGSNYTTAARLERQRLELSRAIARRLGQAS